jgi:NAD(P)-dependent dehydrogenase (short-subunit alcohol dehydrogenase family)
MADDKQIALVTGANKGLGFETSRQLAALGIKVLMAREAKRGAEILHGHPATTPRPSGKFIQ